MSRWNFITNILGKAQRGILSLFICVIVMLPLILGGIQAKNAFVHIDSRKLGEIAALQTRPIDQTTEAIKPFDQPLITVTFDDGWESVYTTALPLFQKYGIPTTQYVLSGVSDDERYLSVAQIKNLQKLGHDIGCHTVDHADLVTVNDDQLKHELKDCKTTMEEELGTKVVDFASPYGSSNDKTMAAIKNIYRSHRNTNGDITTNGVSDQDVNMRNGFNVYDIQAITLRRETTIEELQRAIDYTVKNNAWLVLNYHDVEEGGSKFGLNAETLEAQLAAISKAKARVVTMAQVLDTMEKANTVKVTTERY